MTNSEKFTNKSSSLYNNENKIVRLNTQNIS